MPETVKKPPAMPASVADAWAAVYIDVSEKLESAKGADDRSPGREGSDKPVATEDS
jgi:hypothetical protein